MQKKSRRGHGCWCCVLQVKTERQNAGQSTQRNNNGGSREREREREKEFRKQTKKNPADVMVVRLLCLLFFV
jgi:hypothetical protein